MTPIEFCRQGVLIWGPYGWQQRAAAHFGVSDRTVRRWAAGHRAIPAAVAEELDRLLERAPLPPIAPPPGGSSPEEGRDDACAAAIRDAYVALAAAAERAGWTTPEVLTALLSWAVSDARNLGGPEAAAETLRHVLRALETHPQDPENA